MRVFFFFKMFFFYFFVEELSLKKRKETQPSSFHFFRYQFPNSTQSH